MKLYHQCLRSLYGILILILLGGCYRTFEYPLDPDGDQLDAYKQYTAYKRLFPLKSLRWLPDKRAMCICLSRTFIELREKKNEHHEGTLIMSVAPYHTPLNDLPVVYYMSWNLPPEVVAPLLDTLSIMANWKAPVDIPNWDYPYGINADFRGPPYGECIFEYATEEDYHFKRYDGFASQQASVTPANQLKGLISYLHQHLQLNRRMDSLTACLPIGTYVSLQGSMLYEVKQSPTCGNKSSPRLETSRPYRNRDDF